MLILMVSTKISNEQKRSATSEKRKSGSVREQTSAEAGRQHVSYPTVAKAGMWPLGGNRSGES
jgi:hypothetical protein